MGSIEFLAASPHLLSLWGDGVELINKDDCRSVLLRLFEGLPQVTLTLARQLAHDLRTWREESMTMLNLGTILSKSFWQLQFYKIINKTIFAHDVNLSWNLIL